MGDVTRLLERWHEGDGGALGELMPLVYAELRQPADHFMLRERSNHTLQPTALVHEAFLRLTNVRDASWSITRAAAPPPSGEDPVVVAIDDAPEVGIDLRLGLVALDDALERLAAVAPRAAKAVELRYFGGMTIEEAAEFLSVAPVTVKRHWTFARAWRYRALQSGEE